MADEHSTTTTTVRDRPGGSQTVSTTTHTSNSGTGLVIGALVVLLLVLAWLFLGGDDGDVATAPDTTEVVEPGAADGGADEPVSTEPNEAGTAADPAVDTDAAAGADATTDTDTGTTGN